MEPTAFSPSPEELAVILGHIPDGVTVQDKTGRLIYANDAAAALSGFRSGREMSQASGSEIIKKFEIYDETGDILPPADLPGSQVLRTGLAQGRIMRFSPAHAGEEHWTQVKATPVLDEEGKVSMVINIFRDITDLYLNSQVLVEREHEQSVLLNTIIAEAPNGFALFDREHRYIRINQALAEINGRSVEDHIGLEVREVVPSLADKMIPLLDRVFSMTEPITNVEISGETPAQPGVIRHWLVNYYPIQTKTGRILGVGTIINEITERKQIEQNLRKSEQNLRLLAFHDPLTGLPNRKLLFDRLVQTIKQSGRTHEPLAVLFLDLDRFKNINDTLGHVAGDELLKEVALRLTKCIREVDTAARTGGDEFVVLLNGVRSTQDAIRVARKILKAIVPTFVIDGRKLHISTSIGIALYPVDGDDALTLIKNADTALYRAKEAGGNNYQLYNKTMGIETSEKLRLENELRLAIDNGELTMYYQPIVDVKTGAISQVEALMRWQHPTLGLIYPNEFIPMAEETGMIVHMTGAIFRQVTKQLTHWQKMGLGQFRIAINLSGRQFMQPNMVQRIGGYLKEMKLDPKYLELEITETLAMKDIGTSIQKLEQLKRLGVSISVDDFGTGYSSLNYLKRMPIDSVKIDRSFIQNCITDAQDAAIIKAIISMAHSLGLKVVGEGVESEEQWNLLASMECDAIQGYLVSRPLPPQEFTKFLRGWNPK